MTKEALQLAQQIAVLAEEKKAEEMVVIDMTAVSGLCDYFVVCSATSQARAKAIADHVERQMKKAKHKALHCDGKREGLWIVLDFSDVMLHVFQHQTREFYNIEELWSHLPRVKLPKAAA